MELKNIIESRKLKKGNKAAGTTVYFNACLDSVEFLILSEYRSELYLTEGCMTIEEYQDSVTEEKDWLQWCPKESDKRLKKVVEWSSDFDGQYKQGGFCVLKVLPYRVFLHEDGLTKGHVTLCQVSYKRGFREDWVVEYHPNSINIPLTQSQDNGKRLFVYAMREDHPTLKEVLTEPYSKTIPMKHSIDKDLKVVYSEEFLAELTEDTQKFLVEEIKHVRQKAAIREDNRRKRLEQIKKNTEMMTVLLKKKSELKSDLDALFIDLHETFDCFKENPMGKLDEAYSKYQQLEVSAQRIKDTWGQIIKDNPSSTTETFEYLEHKGDRLSRTLSKTYQRLELEVIDDKGWNPTTCWIFKSSDFDSRIDSVLKHSWIKIQKTLKERARNRPPLVVSAKPIRKPTALSKPKRS